MFYREPVMWPSILFEEQRASLTSTLEKREEGHQCTGNCGHFVEQPSSFSPNSYYQLLLTRGRIRLLPKVLPKSEPDTTGWTRSNVQKAKRSLDITYLDTYIFSM